MSEFDRLGRDEFLSRYGFGRARRYFLEHDGKRYDSKAIVGAAHRHQHGTALAAADFSGGESAAVARLSALGFTVTNPHEDWRTPLGSVMTRTEIARLYGGAIYGGIEPSRTSPNVIIYTDPAQGRLNGYDYDGWDEDDPSIFYYTGKGRRGDQVMADRNQSVLEHEEAGRTLRLFEALEEASAPGGKRHRYVGAFKVDLSAPYEMKPATDADGQPRQVIVFRLIRQEVVEHTRRHRDSGTGSRLRRRRLSRPQLPNRPFVEVVASENNLVDTYATSVPESRGEAIRKEASLVRDFESWLEEQAHEVGRVRIRIPGESHTLISDTYNLTTKVLFEAKSSVDRATIRLALGQLLDYLRFVPVARGAILLPHEPTADLRDLISSCGFGLAFRSGDSWTLVEPPDVH